ncbi:MAG: hypothetical protein AB1546_09650, partial [bacterium]
MKRTIKKSLWVLFFLFGISFAAYAGTQSICVVPQGKCTSETSPCTGLASADLLDAPVSHTDGDTTKISYQFEQGSTADTINTSEEIVLDVCYEIGAADGEIGLFNVVLTPTGFDTTTAATECAFSSTDCTSQGYSDCTTGWHALTSAISTDCMTGSTIESTYMHDTYGDHNGNGVILARVKFAGVNKKSADPATLTAPNYTPGADYIATLVLETATEVDDENTVDITGTEIDTDVQTIIKQGETCAPTAATTNAISCVPSGSCTATSGDGDITLNWTASAGCKIGGSDVCGTPSCITGYDIYRGDTEETAVKINTSTVTVTTYTDSDVSGAIDGSTSTKTKYYIYAKSTEYGDSPSALNGSTYSVDCQCGEPPTMTVTEPTRACVGTNLSITGTVTDTDSSDITLDFYYGTDDTFAAHDDFSTIECTGNCSNQSFTVTIPSSAIVEGEKMWWGIVARDELDLEGVYPT